MPYTKATYIVTFRNPVIQSDQHVTAMDIEAWNNDYVFFDKSEQITAVFPRSLVASIVREDK